MVLTEMVSFPRGMLTVPTRSSIPLVWFHNLGIWVDHSGIYAEKGLLPYERICCRLPDIYSQGTIILGFQNFFAGFSLGDNFGGISR